MKNSPLGDEIFGVCIVLDVADCFARRGFLLGGFGAVTSWGVDIKEGGGLVVVDLCYGFGGAWFVGVFGCSALGEEVVVRIVEMICCVAEGVDFEFRQEVLRDFLQEPIENHTAFNTALRMEDEDDFGEMCFVEC